MLHIHLAFKFLIQLPEGFLLSDTLMKSKTVLKDKGHEDALHQGETLNRPLHHLPKRLLPPKVDRCNCVADHDITEENDPDGNEAVETERNADEDTSKSAENFSNDMTSMD